MGTNVSRAVFKEIFAEAPSWLIYFARVQWDANFLQFDLPRVRSPLEWGSYGLNEARNWPTLPSGTMTDGDPIASNDPRQFELAMFTGLSFVTPVPNFSEHLCQAAEDEFFPTRNPLVDDVSFVLALDQKPEDEWTLYERRRVRRITEYMKREGRKYYETLAQLTPEKRARRRTRRRRLSGTFRR